LGGTVVAGLPVPVVDRRPDWTAAVSMHAVARLAGVVRRLGRALRVVRWVPVPADARRRTFSDAPPAMLRAPPVPRDVADVCRRTRLPAGCGAPGDDRDRRGRHIV